MTCPHCGADNADNAKFCRQCGKELAAGEFKPTEAASPSPGALAGLALYAGFWRRTAALLIDAIPVGIISWIVGVSTHTQSIFWWNVEGISDARGFLIGAIIGWLYFAMCESSGSQATLGKMIIGLYVTDEGGSRITFRRATGRHFGKYISAVLLCIGFMMAGFTEKKQGLHDMLADTLVMRHPPIPA